jgi:hypothetical protein
MQPFRPHTESISFPISQHKTHILDGKPFLVCYGNSPVDERLRVTKTTTTAVLVILGLAEHQMVIAKSSGCNISHLQPRLVHHVNEVFQVWIGQDQAFIGTYNVLLFAGRYYPQHGTRPHHPGFLLATRRMIGMSVLL